MESFITNAAQHGYTVLFAVVFCEAIGLPFPAALALLVAGGAAAHGALDPALAWGGALAVMMFADTMMFLLGRWTGWWLLGVLCRLSLNPESCILQSADTFYKRGRILLLFAKFVPGINTLAPPLAGSMNMSPWAFLKLDLAGATLYTGVYFAAGYVFSDVLTSILSGYEAVGRVVGIALGIVFIGFLATRFRAWFKARDLRQVPVVDPEEAARRVDAHEAVIYDVRSHGYYDPKATRIQGSQRLEPNALHQTDAGAPKDSTVLLYCTCIREATSARVAKELMDRGLRVAVIKGGLRNWRKRGLPVEPVPPQDLALMPNFS